MTKKKDLFFLFEDDDSSAIAFDNITCNTKQLALSKEKFDVSVSTLVESATQNMKEDWYSRSLR